MATSLANPIDVKALSDQGEPCSCGNSCYHLSGHGVVYVTDVSTSSANEVRVRLHIRVESCLTIYKSQFLNQAQFLENVKGLVDCRETDCGVHRLDFSVHTLRGRMISTAKRKSTDRDPLRCCLVSFLAKSLDYRRIRGRVVHFRIDY